MASIRVHPARPLALGAGLLASFVLLAGCGLLDGPPEAQRDEPGGEITASSDAGVFSLQVGDCLDEAPTESTESVEVESVPVVPCSEPHTGEVFAEHQLEEGDYPGDEAVQQTGLDHCHSVFAEFVGLTYEESALELWAFFPTEESWTSSDDRTVHGVVGPAQDTVTGSLEGSAV